MSRQIQFLVIKKALHKFWNKIENQILLAIKSVLVFSGVHTRHCGSKQKQQKQNGRQKILT
jgi:hypothetical protein